MMSMAQWNEMRRDRHRATWPKGGAEGAFYALATALEWGCAVRLRTYLSKRVEVAVSASGVGTFFTSTPSPPDAVWTAALAELQEYAKHRADEAQARADALRAAIEGSKA
jgi:hypothetical protein